ncbi:MAG TPA: ATP cone domain-containing protein [Elusimicrobiota bacterium]|nr:ATP cone domain-containing protein [Elusimicrobiota bacterium]
MTDQETTPPPDPKAENQLNLFNVSAPSKISHVIKRDGRLISFDKAKIANSIFNAATAVGGKDRALAESLADQVLVMINQLYPYKATPSVQEIQDIIEKVLIENGHARTSKAFILHRVEEQRKKSQKDDHIIVEDNIPYKLLWKVFTWNVEHGCESVEKINEHIQKGTWPRLIEEAEKAYHLEIQKVADKILERTPELRLIIVAGPSSSGKTTTTTKISEKLKDKNLSFVLMNLDNYFKNLECHPKDEYGDYDFETPQALDLPLINEHLADLLKGKTVNMPIYNFKTGVREDFTKEFRLEKNQILLIDSLHGLFDEMTLSVPSNLKFKFYIEAMCQIRDTKGEFVRWADLRMLRRMIRDSWHRSYNPERTVGHWHYVRRSEMRYIVPFIHTVDYVFNGALPYELPIHKKFMFPVFDGIIDKYKSDPKKLDAYMRAQRVHDLLESFREGDDSVVPKNSLMREFIGGSSYHY